MCCLAVGDTVFEADILWPMLIPKGICPLREEARAHSALEYLPVHASSLGSALCLAVTGVGASVTLALGHPLLDRPLFGTIKSEVAQFSPGHA